MGQIGGERSFPAIAGRNGRKFDALSEANLA
jgi:hypothetical protein